MYRRSRVSEEVSYWPGFVDAITTLLLVTIFLLSVFVLAQFFLTQEISGRDTALSALRGQIAELTNVLALEESERTSLEDQLRSLRSSLGQMERERSTLVERIASRDKILNILTEEKVNLHSKLTDEQTSLGMEHSRVELLSLRVEALRRQLVAIGASLDAADEQDKRSQAKISDLGRRLNIALASKVQELTKYRSEFFGSLRRALSKIPNIRVVGDRFVLPAEILFPSGSSELNASGREEMGKIAQAIRSLEAAIPAEIRWVLRIDGHTDMQPIVSTKFPSNWELSVARSIAVVRFLVQLGVPPQRLVAAGFGEFQPIDLGTSPTSLARNRRIEIKLTER